MSVQKIVPPGALRRYDVNRPGSQEVIKQPLYDYQTYASAGQTSLTFFQIPQGQNNKTLADTNMEQAGALPQPKQFLIKAIEIHFASGVTPGSFGAQAASNYINDVEAVAHSGHVQLFIGSKPYLDEAPIGVFPTSWRLYAEASMSDSSTAGANQQGRVDYAKSVGPVYELPPLLIPSQQNFRVTLTWPTAVALPSGVNGRIGVRLLGDLYRLSQ